MRICVGGSEGRLTHSYGLKVDISCGDLEGDGSHRTRSCSGGGGRHTSKEVPNMLSLTKDMWLARGMRWRDWGDDRMGSVGKGEKRGQLL